MQEREGADGDWWGVPRLPRSSRLHFVSFNANQLHLKHQGTVRRDSDNWLRIVATTKPFTASLNISLNNDTSY